MSWDNIKKLKGVNRDQAVAIKGIDYGDQGFGISSRSPFNRGAWQRDMDPGFTRGVGWPQNPEDDQMSDIQKKTFQGSGISDSMQKKMMKQFKRPQTAGQKQRRDFGQQEQETGRYGYEYKKPSLNKKKPEESNDFSGKINGIKRWFKKFTSSQ